MARRKQQALDVPASAEEAVALIETYVSAERQAMKVRLAIEVLIDEAKAERDTKLAAIDAEQKLRFASLKAWWEAGGRDVAKGKRSAELAGAAIGVRLTPPKVKLGRGVKLDAAIAWLRRQRWVLARSLVRPKFELNKPAIIQAVRDDDVKRRLADAGITVDQADEFFIDAGLDEDAIRKEFAAG